MMSPIYNSKLNVDNFEIKVEIYCDDTSSPLEFMDVDELKSNPLPVEWCKDESPFDYTDFAIDNFYRTAYFTVSSNDWPRLYNIRYFMLKECPKELQKEFSKLGYAKHDAWLKALQSLKSQAVYLQSWFNDQWQYVGFVITTIETMTDDNGLIWSREVKSEHNSLWGIEWNAHSPWGNEIIDNESIFKMHVPELLPNCIKLTDTQLNNLWENLE